VSEVVKQLESALSNQPANPLRNHQVEEYQAEAKRLRDITTAPAYVTGVDRGAAAKRSREVEKAIATQAATPLSGAEKDRVAKLAAEVLEREIRPALLPREEMRRNPAGAVGRFLKEENSPRVQHAIQQWKRAQLAVESGNPDPDLANIERFRPEKIHATGGAATFMADAQIPGQFAMTPQAKENWPLGEPTATTAIAEVKQREKREMSEAQKAALVKAQAARAAKREAASQAG
jgi:hypothetical protein